MGLLLRKEDDRTQLQTKVAADLQQRLAATQPVETHKPEPAILADQHRTRMIGMVISILLVVLVLAVVVVVSRS